MVVVVSRGARHASRSASAATSPATSTARRCARRCSACSRRRSASGRAGAGPAGVGGGAAAARRSRRPSSSSSPGPSRAAGATPRPPRRPPARPGRGAVDGGDRPFLVRALLDELPLKIVSLVIAVTLFVIVRSDKDAATGAYVKVVYTLPQDRVLVSDPVGEVRVGVRGPWTRLQRFDERAARADPRRSARRRRRRCCTSTRAWSSCRSGLRVASITPRRCGSSSSRARSARCRSSRSSRASRPKASASTKRDLAAADGARRGRQERGRGAAARADAAARGRRARTRRCAARCCSRRRRATCTSSIASQVMVRRRDPAGDRGAHLRRAADPDHAA